MVKDDEGQWSVEPDTCIVYVIKVNLDIVGVPEEDEDEPGGYIAVNTDDDNKNSTQDRDPVETTVDNEDDLVEISLKIEPNMPVGSLKLQVGPFGLLTIWDGPTKGTNPMTQATWDLSEGPFPQSLWVEAYLVSYEFPVSGLQLSYLHPTMGHYVDWDTVKFNPVKVRLFMDGVSEDTEEFPGNYILYNKDDDDDDGVPDYDDGYNKDGIPGNEDDENTAEDDLVKIMPHWVEPTTYMSGTVTFDVTLGDSKVKVWKSKTKGEDNEISFSPPPTYNTPADLPQEFWVEGVEPSEIPCDVVFTLSYTKGGLTFKDRVNVTVVHVELFRDSDYTKILDDWPKSGDLLRSPKYIFGEDDPIYVQVKNIGTDPETAEIINSVVSVNSAIDGLAYLTLHETGVDTQIFNNSAFPGELLYLSTENFQGNGDKIKVIDEEVLYFWLKMPPRDGGIYKRSVDVKVDRGEFLAVAGSESSDLHYWFDNVPYFNQNISDAKSKMQNDYKWWQNGYMIGKHYDIDDYGPSDQQYESSKETAIDAGAETAFSCSDFLFYTGHGDEGILSIIRTVEKGYVSWDPQYSSAGSGWANDVEFCVFTACSVLGTSNDPCMFVKDWINNLFPKGIHAVLSTSGDAMVEAMDDDFGEFLDRLKNGETAVNAYKQACYAGLNTPYGILVREENLNDYILTPVSSDGASLTRDYTTTDNTFYYFYYNGNQMIINPAGEGQHIKGSNRYYSIKRKIDEAMGFQEEIQIDILSLDEEEKALSIPVEISSLFEHTHTEKFSFYGWNKFGDSNIPEHTVEVSESAERDHLTSLGLEVPSDYILDSRGKMMVSKYLPNLGGEHLLGQIWCEGETFEFIREYNGHKIFNDRLRIAIQNNKIISYSLTRHPLKKTSASIVKKPHFRSKDSSIKWDILHPSLVYRVKEKAVVPYWQVQYDNYLFHYDIEKVSNIR